MAKSMTVPQLRAALAEAGLETKGLKSELVARLEAHQAGGAAPKEEEEEEEEEVKKKPAKKAAASKKRKADEIEPAGSDEAKPPATKKRKGTPKVDPNSGLDGEVYVDDNGEVYDVMLNQVNIGNNNNKFYVIQLINDNGYYTVYTRWGRVGEVGTDGPLDCGTSLQKALQTFAKKFKDKSANVWAPGVRENFKTKAGKYTLLEMDWGGDEEETKAIEVKTPSGPVKVKQSKLNDATQSFIKLIFDLDMFKQAMVSFEIDVERMPLGKLSASTIKKGRDCLHTMMKVINGEEKGSLTDLSSTFYTYIPHAYGRGTRPPVLNSVEAIQKKIDMCNVLGDIEIAQSMLKNVDTSSGEVEHPLDANYHTLKADLEHLPASDKEYKVVQQYLKGTGPNYLKLMDVWKVNRHGEGDRFKAHDDIVERKLLWHGTNVAVVVAILGSGLRIMPHSGGRVGKGLYFASENSKSAGYVGTAPDGSGIMFLAEVALGKQHEINADDHTLKQAPKGYDSIVARGWTEPDPKNDTTLTFEGKEVTVPQGPVIKTKWNSNSSFSQSEYLVYKESQVRIRYVLRIKFH